MVCDRDLYLWHWFARRCGTNNDKTIVSVSPLFSDILGGRYVFKLSAPYYISPDSVARNNPYYLADRIYPAWPNFAKPVHKPTNRVEGSYSKRQEAIRKDIKRCFGVLQARFRVLRQESALWDITYIVRVS